MIRGIIRRSVLCYRENGRENDHIGSRRKKDIRIHTSWSRTAVIGCRINYGIPLIGRRFRLDCLRRLVRVLNLLVKTRSTRYWP